MEEHPTGTGGAAADADAVAHIPPLPKPKVGDMSVDDLEALIRKVVREELDRPPG